MANQPAHMLTTMGVLTSFSISKKITEQEVNSVIEGAKAKGMSEDEVMDLVKKRIMKEIIEATHSGILPGIIIEQSETPIIPIQSIEALNRMVLVLSQKLKSKKIDKLSLCYFINYLVGSLGLTEEDFDDFHRRIREAHEKSDDYDDDDE